MARFRSDAGQSVRTALLAACLLAVPAIPAELTGTLKFESWSRLEFNVQDDSVSLWDAEISHGSDMFIRASRATRVQGPGRVNELTLSGGVHINYRGAVLDADSALIVLRDQKFQSARVQGSQATFSHQPPGSTRRAQGRADVIEFDGTSDRVKLSGRTSFDDGQLKCNIEALVYDLSAGKGTNTRSASGMDNCTMDLDGAGGVLEFESWSRLEFIVQDDTISLWDAEISHGSDMFTRAARAVGVQRPGRVNELTLSGGAHITYRGAVLDADSALIVFSEEKLQSARVRGSQATFSHQPSGSARRIQGRADVIDFDGTSDRVKLSGKTSYDDGRARCKVEEVLYDLSLGRATNRNTGTDQCVLDLNSSDRVPTPRTPDRSTAQ